MQDLPNKNDLIARIAKKLKCSACGRTYRLCDFHLLEERDAVSVMRLVCCGCRKQSLVLAVVRRRQIHSFFSELAPDEWMYFSRAQPLDVDDVIAIHRQMQVYDGDFSEVLEDPLPPGAED